MIENEPIVEAWMIQPQKVEQLAVSEDPSERAKAAQAARYLAEDVRRTLLLELSKDPDAEVRELATESLGYVPGQDIENRLLELLDADAKECDGVRVKAYRALGRRNNAEI